MNFSVYKRKQISELVKKYPEMTKEEVGPLTNFGVSLIPPKFAIQNAPAEELAELKRTYPSKILFKREVTYAAQANQAVPMFRQEIDSNGFMREPEEDGQVLHSKDV